MIIKKPDAMLLKIHHLWFCLAFWAKMTDLGRSFAAKEGFLNVIYYFLRNIHWGHPKWNLSQKYGIRIVSTRVLNVYVLLTMLRVRFSWQKRRRLYINPTRTWGWQIWLRESFWTMAASAHCRNYSNICNFYVSWS